MKKLVFIIVLSLTSIAQHLEAQNIYKVTRSTFGNGGGYCSNDTYQLNGTISQSFIGHTQNDQHQGKIGFWYRAQSGMTTSSRTLVEHRMSGFNLKQNEPNPFQGVTEIGFTLPKRSSVRLAIVDALGREVEVLVDETMVAGNYQVPFDAKALRSGIYFYQLQTGQFSKTRQMVLVK